MITFPAISLIAARRRRVIFFSIVLVIYGVGLALMSDILTDGGVTGIEVALLGVFAILFSLVAYGFTLASVGFWVLWRGHAGPLTHSLATEAEPGSLPTTAIVMPIYNEDVSRVFQGIQTMFESLQKTGHGSAFDFFILSDSSDPNHWVEEEKAWLELCRRLNAFGRIFYRKRRITLHHKSGNIADFCRRWGARYRYMTVLDADSIMTGDCLVKLTLLMERNPSAGLIQTDPKLVLGKTFFRRAQQFASRVYGPLFAAGSSFWHFSGGNFWGHNAIIRLKPFMEFCALPELPKIGPLGGRILSHDTVEAALMRKAGYGVWTAYDLTGSYEEGPPNLLNALKRDRRWCQGNMQHLLLLFAPGLRKASRIHLAVGVMAYLSAPLWFAFLVLSTIDSLTEASLPTSGGAALWNSAPMKAGLLFGFIFLLLLIPKGLGAILAMRKKHTAAEFGGRLDIVKSVLVETVYSVFTAPILMLFYSKFVLSAFLGLKVRWTQQNRGAGQVPSWRELIATHGTQTLMGVTWLVSVAIVQPSFLPWLAPVLAGLILAIPFARLTASLGFGNAVQQAGIFTTPEETNPPAELNRIEQRFMMPETPFFERAEYAADYGLLQAILDPYVHSVHVSLLRQRDTPANDKAREHPEELSRRLLTDGPAALSADERATLLWDAESMLWLHRTLWLSPNAKLHHWWREALRHYNESLAFDDRRSAAV